MPRVRHREEHSPSRRRGPGGRTEPGGVIDVSEELAEQLLAKPYFEPVADAAVEADGDETDDTADESASEFDTDEWLDEHHETRAKRVRSGDVDEHLEPIADAETSDSVLDAIGERRAELEA